MPFPFLLLLLVSLLVGCLVTLGARRIAPARGATTAAAEAIEGKAEQIAAREGWLRSRMDPELATGLALSVAVLALIVAGVIVGVLGLLVRRTTTLRELDSSVAGWGHDHATHVSTRLLQLVTDLGDWPAVSLIGVVVVLYELQRRPNWFIVPFVLLVPLGDSLVTNTIKQLVDRARPTLNPVAASLGPSFPSGHSSTAASFYAALALVLSRGRSPRVRAVLIGIAAGIATAVASSRVLLDVHWLSDVIAGLALGWGWFALCAIAFGGRMLRFGAPAEKLAGAEPGALESARSR